MDQQRARTLLTPRTERALRRALVWHRDQERRGSGVPYAQHVLAVALILDRLGFDEDVVIAGLLHDAVEDTGATLDAVEAEFGPRVAAIVAACSERKADAEGRKRPWLDRKREHIEVLAGAPVEARAVALADKLHNLLSLDLDLREGRDVWALFHAGPEQVVWYYDECLARYVGGDPRLATLAAECRAVLDSLPRPQAPRDRPENQPGGG